jgi:peptidoglycan hydrolase-like protein with peptidoglycan-binding domain
MAEPLIKKSSKGAAVKKLQNLLIGVGYDPGAADGIFGAQTETAVKEFQANYVLVSEEDQAEYHLEIDGIVGPKTWAALGG